MLKLTKKERENYNLGLEKIGIKSDEELINELERIYDKITFPPKNESFKNWTKEQIFMSVLRSENLLYYFYNKALKNNKPKILLDAFHTFNHIESTFELKGGYDHCLRLKPVLFCYAGNNYKLVDQYLPINIVKSKKGIRFLVTAINLIMSIRNQLNKREILKDIEIYLSKKNSKFEIAIIKTLLGILNKDYNDISIHLNEVTKLHKSSKWLHDFGNPIGKYLPFFSYGLYSMTYKHLGIDLLDKVNTPEQNIWWNEYKEINLNTFFSEGEDVISFGEKLKFINEIKTTPNIV